MIPVQERPSRAGRLVGLLAVSGVLVLIAGAANMVRTSQQQGWFTDKELSDSDVFRAGDAVGSAAGFADALLVVVPAMLAVLCLVAVAVWSGSLGRIRRRVLTVVSAANLVLILSVYFGRGGAILLSREPGEVKVSFIPLAGVAAGLQLAAGLMLLIAGLVAATPNPGPPAAGPIPQS